MHQGQSKWILVSYPWFYASISLILLFWFISMNLYFSYIFLYFIFLYLRIYSRRGTWHLLPLQGYARAPTFRSEPTTRWVFASAHRDLFASAHRNLFASAHRNLFASTHHDLFASAIPTRLHPLDAGLPNTFLRVMGGVETRATYDLIGKSWPGARYMRGEPRNTVSLSSVLDHHWGVSFGPLLV